MDHVDVAGDVFVRNAIEHVSDDGGGFGYRHSDLLSNFFPEKTIADRRRPPGYHLPYDSGIHIVEIIHSDALQNASDWIIS